MEIKDIKGKKVTVMGLGLHGGGLGVAKFFAKHGAHVLATDIKLADELEASIEKLKGLKIKYVLGQHRLEDFVNTNLVMQNPGVPENSKYLLAAKEHKVPIETDLGLFFDWCPAPIVGVTGTKGKSTTASLIAAMLNRVYDDVFLAGNNRASVLEILPDIENNDIVVLELSSWQLAGIRSHKKSPQVAVLTNIYPDHLNRYDSLGQYIQDKKVIFKWQKPDDVLVLNYDDNVVRNFAKDARDRVCFYSLTDLTLVNDHDDLLAQAKIGAFLQGKKIFYGSRKHEVCQSKDFTLRGQHNIANLLAAISAVKVAYQTPSRAIRQALRHYKSLTGRLEMVAQKHEVRYINDTCATIPEATIAALKSLNEQNIILIAGGAAKGLGFQKLAKFIVKRVKVLVLLIGSATEQLEKKVRKELVKQGKDLKIVVVDSMVKAVNSACQEAASGDVVLLSPACASFGMFKHEFDRGDQFMAAVKSLK